MEKFFGGFRRWGPADWFAFTGMALFFMYKGANDYIQAGGAVLYLIIFYAVLYVTFVKK